MLVIGFKLVAAAIASNAFTGVAIGVGFIFAFIPNKFKLSNVLTKYKTYTSIWETWLFSLIITCL